VASKQNIFLVGPMGSGKTTIGKVVAREFGLEFYDSDQELERLTGASVNLIFDVEGEAGFRERETRLLRDLTRKQGVLIATGGGAVTTAENRRLLRQGGLVVWLKTSVAQQLKRLSHDNARPLLQAPDRKARLEALAQQRNPHYHSVADLEFTSPEHHSKLAAQALIRSIQEFREAHDEESAHAKR
jgi:shikimate kinase